MAPDASTEPADPGPGRVTAVSAVVPIRPASTVMLLRDAAGQLEVYVLQRVSGMAFAPSMTVFPGGGVDSFDYPAPAHAGGGSGGVDGMTAQEVRRLAGALGTDEYKAVALLTAAVREVHEEVGVLLQASLMRPWANWITPEGGTRRYDTFFFAAALPPGQEPRLLTTEADHGYWSAPAALLAALAEGGVLMLPPTIAMLTDLAEFPSVATVLDASRTVRPLTPVLLSEPGEPLRVAVAGREYGVGR